MSLDGIDGELACYHGRHTHLGGAKIFQEEEGDKLLPEKP